MSRPGLTPHQNALLAYLEVVAIDGRIGASYEEMTAALGLSSKSSIHRLVVALERRGFLRRLPHCARSLELIEQDKPAPGALHNISTADLLAEIERRGHVISVPAFRMPGAGGDARVDTHTPSRRTVSSLVHDDRNISPAQHNHG